MGVESGDRGRGHCPGQQSVIEGLEPLIKCETPLTASFPVTRAITLVKSQHVGDKTIVDRVVAADGCSKFGDERKGEYLDFARLVSCSAAGFLHAGVLRDLGMFCLSEIAQIPEHRCGGEQPRVFELSVVAALSLVGGERLRVKRPEFLRQLLAHHHDRGDG